MALNDDIFVKTAKSATFNVHMIYLILIFTSHFSFMSFLPTEHETCHCWSF